MDEKLPSDAVLILWIIIGAAWDVLVFTTTTYLVFWKGHSGWWYILAILLTYSESLFKVLRKRFGLPSD